MTYDNHGNVIFFISTLNFFNIELNPCFWNYLFVVYKEEISNDYTCLFLFMLKILYMTKI